MSRSDDIQSILQEMNSFILQTDVCVNCLADEIDGSLLILKIPMTIKDKLYDTAAVFICKDCSGRASGSRIMENLELILGTTE